MSRMAAGGGGYTLENFRKMSSEERQRVLAEEFQRERDAMYPPIMKSKFYFGTRLRRVSPLELVSGVYFERHRVSGMIENGIVHLVEAGPVDMYGDMNYVWIHYNDMVRPEQSRHMMVRLSENDAFYMDMMADEIALPGLRSIEPTIASNSLIAKEIAQQVRNYVGKPVESGKYRHRFRYGSQKGGRRTRRS